MEKPEPEKKKTPRQIAEELAEKGLIKWEPSRPGHGLTIVGTSVPGAEAEPKMTTEKFREKYKTNDRTVPGRIITITGHPPPRRLPNPD